jgi:hypothetical protein
MKQEVTGNWQIALDRTCWKTRFGSGCVSVARQNRMVIYVSEQNVASIFRNEVSSAHDSSTYGNTVCFVSKMFVFGKILR